MYLTSAELTTIATTVISGCDHDGHPFENSQIRVCSIDLRVGPTFWKFSKRRRPIDLTKHSIFEISERRLWKKVVLKQGESILLRPGEMLLGSTYERITIPRTHVGKINTRSSYARLGLSTACNCDLVNPGYSGHVPLELTNSTKNSFRIYPYLPLCQIFLMRLDGEVHVDYNNAEFGSLYVNDDGGPSRWWRDSLAKKISKKALPNQMEERTLAELRKKFDRIDDAGIFRLERLLDRKQFGSSEELMMSFQKSERWRSVAYRLLKGVSFWLLPISLLSCLGAWLAPDSDVQTIFGVRTKILTCLLTAALAVPAAYFFLTPNRRYYSVIEERQDSE